MPAGSDLLQGAAPTALAPPGPRRRSARPEPQGPAFPHWGAASQRRRVLRRSHIRGMVWPVNVHAGRAPPPGCGSLPPSGGRLSWTSQTNQLCWMHGFREVACIVCADRLPRRRGAGLKVAVHKRIGLPVPPGLEGSTGQLLVPHLDARPAQEAEQVRGNLPGCPRLLPLWGQRARGQHVGEFTQHPRGPGCRQSRPTRRNAAGPGRPGCRYGSSGRW